MKRIAVTAIVLTALLSGCGAKAPKGIDAAALDDGVGNTIGDPTTCVLIVEKGSGKVVYRYGSHMTCGTQVPSCQGAATTTADDLAKADAAGEAKTASCPSPAGGVGYALGPVPTDKPQYAGLAYVAVMNTKRMLPGIEMANRLEGAFRRAGF